MRPHLKTTERNVTCRMRQKTQLRPKPVRKSHCGNTPTTKFPPSLANSLAMIPHYHDKTPLQQKCWCRDKSIDQSRRQTDRHRPARRGAIIDRSFDTDYVWVGPGTRVGLLEYIRTWMNVLFLDFEENCNTKYYKYNLNKGQSNLAESEIAAFILSVTIVFKSKFCYETFFVCNVQVNFVTRRFSFAMCYVSCACLLYTSPSPRD